MSSNAERRREMTERAGKLTSKKKLDANKVNYCACPCGGVFFVIQYGRRTNCLEMFCAKCGEPVLEPINVNHIDGSEKLKPKIDP